MTDSHDPGLYDLFVSYSNLDNVIPDGQQEGWVQIFVNRIRELAKAYTQQNLTTTDDQVPGFDAEYRAFFDKEDIQCGQDWESRLISAVSNTRVLLACLSPNYWKSNWCEREWKAYLENEAARGLANMEGGITPIYIATEPGIRTQAIIEAAPFWAREMLISRQVRLLPFETHGLDALARLNALKTDPSIAKNLDIIAARISGQIKHARRAEGQKQGNLASGTDIFVGRKKELATVERQLFGNGAMGVITALRGLGGQGKTALALRYGHNLRSRYTAGCWQVIAAGTKELPPLLATLREPLGLQAIPAEMSMDTTQRVLVELYRRAHQTSYLRSAGDYAAALLVVDNVDYPQLLGQSQREALKQIMNRAGLPGDAGWIHLLATSRLEPHELAFLPIENIITIDALPMVDALALWQRILAAPSKPLSAEEMNSAEKIVALLERHTLAVEIAARHIRRSSGETSCGYLARLEKALKRPGETATILDDQQKRMQSTDLTIANPIVAALRFSFDHLEQEEEGGAAALTVLHYAAHFPPEVIPLPWLRIIAGQHHPELLEEAQAPRVPTAWDCTEMRLTESLRMLAHADGEAPEIAKLHRLVGDFLRQEALESGEDEARRAEVEQFIEKKCAALEPDRFALFKGWERKILAEDLAIRTAREDCSVQIASAATCFAQLLPAFGEVEVAMTLLTQSEAVLRKHIANSSNASLLKLRLSTCLEYAGDIEFDRHNFEQAAAKFEECHFIAEDCLKGDENNHQKLHHLSVCWEKRAKIFAQQGLHEIAMGGFTKSWQIRHRLASETPTNLLWCRDLSISMEKIAECNIALGTFANANGWLKMCKELREQIASSGRMDSAWIRDLWVVYAKQADVAIKLGDHKEAHALYVRAHEITKQISDTDPSNILWRWDVVVTTRGLAAANEKIGEFDAAVENHIACITLADDLVNDHPSNVQFSNDAAAVHLLFGALADRLGNSGVAAHQFSISLQLLESMTKRGMPLTPAMKTNLPLLREMALQLGLRHDSKLP